MLGGLLTECDMPLSLSAEDWGITVEQFIGFVQQCMQPENPLASKQGCEWVESWADLKSKEVKDGKEVVLKPAGHVNAHEVNDHFVKPLTQGTGASVSLLLQHMKGEQPKRAQVMVSHSWNEVDSQRLSFPCCMISLTMRCDRTWRRCWTPSKDCTGTVSTRLKIGLSYGSVCSLCTSQMTQLDQAFRSNST